MKIRVDSPVSPQTEDMCIDVLKPGNVFKANGAHHILTDTESPTSKVYAVKLTTGKLVEFAGDEMVVKRNDLALAKKA